MWVRTCVGREVVDEDSESACPSFGLPLSSSVFPPFPQLILHKSFCAFPPHVRSGVCLAAFLSFFLCSVSLRKLCRMFPYVILNKRRERKKSWEGEGRREKRAEAGTQASCYYYYYWGCIKTKKKKSIKQTSKKMQSERKRLTRTHTHTSIRSLLFFFLTHFFL